MNNSNEKKSGFMKMLGMFKNDKKLRSRFEQINIKCYIKFNN